MLVPPCVAIALDTQQAAASSAAIVVDRCDVVLGQGRCHLVVGEAPADQVAAPGCWTARLQAPSDAPLAATVILHDSTRPERRTVQRTVEFLPRDAPTDRWATLGLLIAALVTIEEHSATEAADEEERAARAREAERAAALLSASRPPARQPGGVGFDARAGALLARGMIPGWALGFRAEATVGSAHWMGQARVSYLPTLSQAGSVDGRQGGDFRLRAAGLGACGARGGAKLSARLCIGGDLNVTDVQGYGVTVPQEHTVTWGSAWVGIAAELRLFSHASLFAGIDGAVGLKRPSFSLDSGDFYRVPRLGGYGSLGLAVPF